MFWIRRCFGGARKNAPGIKAFARTTILLIPPHIFLDNRAIQRLAYPCCGLQQGYAIYFLFAIFGQMALEKGRLEQSAVP
jgi:hypothetical protein